MCGADSVATEESRGWFALMEVAMAKGKGRKQKGPKTKGRKSEIPAFGKGPDQKGGKSQRASLVGAKRIQNRSTRNK
jgi:hypothetical protein